MNAVRLPIQIALHDDELPVSFVNQVAIANGFRSTLEFCEITGLNLNRLAHGAEHEVKSLAQWTGVDPDRLDAFTFKQGQIFAFGNATVKARGFCRAGFRFCPQCCDADASSGSPVIRATWQWRPISCCPVHEIALVLSSCDVGEIGAPPEMVIEAINSTPRPASPKAIALSKYLTDRILRPPGDDFIGRLPVYVALEFFDILGSLDRRVHRGTCLRTGRFEVVEAGYQIARLGTGAISELLSRHVAGVYWSNARRLPVNVHTNAKRWLWQHKDDADYTSIVDLFQSDAKLHAPFATGGTSGRNVAARRVHTVHSASKEYCVPTALVEQLLKDRSLTLSSDDLLPSFKFDATIAGELFGGAGVPLGVQQAAQVLGCSPATITELLDVRLLESVSGDDKDSQETFISSANLSQLLKRLYRNACRTTTMPGLRSLPHCAIASGVSEARIVDLVLAGRLTTVAISTSRPGLGALYLSLREVMRLKGHGI
ncbi:TniQ family protein [Rhizobium sp.]|uniref:TniQ family protein n=1 Tax=Rhizobium sp. TaxID=391 RepID=UPI0034C5CBC4